jgi:DNA repair protein RecO (recombination protein O)
MRIVKMEQTIKGILIHAIRYNDHQLIVRVFTSRFGLKSFLVRSGKTQKSSNTNLLQPLSLIEFESVMKEQSRIHPLKNVRSAHPWQAIPYDPTKSAIVLFLDEVIYKTIPDDYINEHLFRFIWDALILLDDALDGKNFHIWCLLEITRHYGFYPQVEDGHTYFDMETGSCTNQLPAHKDFMDEEVTAVLVQMLDKEWPEVQDLVLNGLLRKRVLLSIVRYIRIHLESLREIKSLEVLHEVFYHP